MYYIIIENDKILSSGECPINAEGFTNIEVSEEVYNSYIQDNDRYIYSDGEIVENPDYEQEKARKERERLDALTLTPADVERALYKAKGMDFEDLKALISQALPNVDIKGLSIEFRAKDFYRGAVANGIRLFDVVGQLLGYTTEDMDYLFIHKDLPNDENPDVST